MKLEKSAAVKITYYLFWVSGLIYTGLNISTRVIHATIHFGKNDRPDFGTCRDEAQLSWITLVWTNVQVYVRRESTISQREIMGIKTDRVQFPKILICADSIHSKERAFDTYPKLNMTMIQQLYGLDVPAMAEVRHRCW